MSKKDMKTFSIRIPSELEEQIRQRAEIMRRSRNLEISILLEKAIDAAVKEDLKILRT